MRCSRFNTDKIYITCYAPLNKQMFQLGEELFYGHLAFPAIAIFFKHSLQLLQRNTNSISFYLTFFCMRYLRILSFFAQYKYQNKSVECLKIENILKLFFKKLTYPGFFLQGTEKIVRVIRVFELSGFE